MIALHNNAVNDTAKYSGGHKGKDEFKLDVDKSKQGNGRRCCQGMEEILATRYGDQGEDKLVGAHKQTNIFRWCVSDELSKCHIGDPDQPDIIT